jgi:hypothetical protein
VEFRGAAAGVDPDEKGVVEERQAGEEMQVVLQLPEEPVAEEGLEAEVPVLGEEILVEEGVG